MQPGRAGKWRLIARRPAQSARKPTYWKRTAPKPAGSAAAAAPAAGAAAPAAAAAAPAAAAAVPVSAAYSRPSFLLLSIGAARVPRSCDLAGASRRREASRASLLPPESYPPLKRGLNIESGSFLLV